MINLKTLSLLSISALMLAACSDGGDSASETGSFAAFDDIGDRIDDRADTLRETPVSAIPTADSATYDGVIDIELGTDLELAGSMTLTTNFADNGISGSVTGIVDENNQPYTGSLAIDGTLFRTGAAPLGADLDGVLNTPNGTDFTVDATMIGDFYGTSAEVVEGDITGIATSTDLPGGTTVIDGDFVGE